MGSYYIKRDLLGLTLQPLTFAQAIMQRKKRTSIVDLTDEELQKLIQQEEEQGRTVDILPLKQSGWWVHYPTDEESDQIRREEEMEEEIERLSSIQPTEEEWKEWENRPRRKTVDIF